MKQQQGGSCQPGRDGRGKGVAHRALLPVTITAPSPIEPRDQAGELRIVGSELARKREPSDAQVPARIDEHTQNEIVSVFGDSIQEFAQHIGVDV